MTWKQARPIMVEYNTSEHLRHIFQKALTQTGTKQTEIKYIELSFADMRFLAKFGYTVNVSRKVIEI